jgi:hypothetical protein
MSYLKVKDGLNSKDMADIITDEQRDEIEIRIINGMPVPDKDYDKLVAYYMHHLGIKEQEAINFIATTLNPPDQDGIITII